jgi:hypothetical protein
MRPYAEHIHNHDGHADRDRRVGHVEGPEVVLPPVDIDEVDNDAGRQPDEYLLCFSHDRLIRIDASVRLPAEGAGALFAAACAEWRGTRAPAGQTPDSCEGRDGVTRFSARLAAVPEPAASAPAAAALSISLFAAAEP